MHKLELFSQWIQGQTPKIYTQLRYLYRRQGQIYPHLFEFNDCRTNEEFEAVYKAIAKKIEGLKKWTADKNTPFSIEIKLQGKLNGKDLHEKFQDVETYRQFLENNALIPPRLLSVVIHRT